MSLRSILEAAVDDEYKGHVLHGIGCLAAFTQGTLFDSTSKLHGLQAYPLLEKPIKLSLLRENERTFIENLLFFPSELKGGHFIVQIFVFFGEIFGKEGEPCFIYAAREDKSSQADVSLYTSNADILAVQQKFNEDMQHLRKMCHGFKAVKAINSLQELEDLFTTAQNVLKEGAKAWSDKYLHNVEFFATQLNLAYAQTFLARIYEKGFLDVKVDLDMSEKFYKLAAEQGQVWSRGVYGEHLYARGLAYIQNGDEQEGYVFIGKAYPYLQTSAIANNVSHCALCADILCEGKAMPRDLRLARSYFQNIVTIIDQIFPDLTEHGMDRINPQWKENKPLAVIYIRALLFCGLYYLTEGTIINGNKHLNRAEKIGLGLFSNTDYAKETVPEMMKLIVENRN
jgi:hypothetical protein